MKTGVCGVVKVTTSPGHHASDIARWAISALTAFRNAVAGPYMPLLGA